MPNEKMRAILDRRKQEKAVAAAVEQHADPDMVIQHSCGHKTGVRWIRDSKCPQCVAADRKARAEKKRAKLAARPQQNDDRRLPHGSQFHLHYDAEKKQWHGQLGIGGQDCIVTYLFGHASGVFKLLSDLDRQYREWLMQEIAREVAGGTVPPAST